MRPVGWRYDSARHALAAKGIRTGYFFRIAKGDELSPQLHLTGRSDRKGTFVGNFERAKLLVGSKPYGEWTKPAPGSAFWSSTFRPGRQDEWGDWGRWVRQEAPQWITDKGVVFKARPDAKILQIRNEDDKKKFLAKYGVRVYGMDIPHEIRWEDVAEDADAVQLTSSGVGRDWSRDPFETWDAESTVWLKRGAIYPAEDAGLELSQRGKDLKALADINEREDEFRTSIFGKYRREGSKNPLDDAYKDPLHVASLDRSGKLRDDMLEVRRRTEYPVLPKGWFALKVWGRDPEK